MCGGKQVIRLLKILIRCDCKQMRFKRQKDVHAEEKVEQVADDGEGNDDIKYQMEKKNKNKKK